MKRKRGKIDIVQSLVKKSKSSISLLSLIKFSGENFRFSRLHFFEISLSIESRLAREGWNLTKTWISVDGTIEVIRKFAIRANGFVNRVKGKKQKNLAISCNRDRHRAIHEDKFCWNPTARPREVIDRETYTKWRRRVIGSVLYQRILARSWPSWTRVLQEISRLKRTKKRIVSPISL